jgi:hypothetical protein
MFSRYLFAYYVFDVMWVKRLTHGFLNEGNADGYENRNRCLCDEIVYEYYYNQL